jgi:hypothetical protein
LTRSLYQCFNAKVSGDRIKCSKGRFLGSAKDGSLSIIPLLRGMPLEAASCQACPEYEEMGSPVEKGDRGWFDLEKRKYYSIR